MPNEPMVSHGAFSPLSAIGMREVPVSVMANREGDDPGQVEPRGIVSTRREYMQNDWFDAENSGVPNRIAPSLDR